MPPARTVIRSNTGFSDPADLSLRVLKDLSVDTVDDFGSVLLSSVNWNKKTLGCLSVSLSADNLRVDEASFHLLGSLWDNKSFHAASFWTTVNPTQLTLSIPDLSIFTFPPGTLCSSYLSSDDCQFSFSQNGQVVPPNLYQATGLSAFCLRLFVYPTSDSYAKVIILIYPFPLTVLASNPLYLDQNFPGLKLADYEFSLAPPALLSPINDTWGFPLAPAVFPGAEWNEDSSVPSGLRLRIALSQLLRSPILPEIKANVTGLKQRYAVLLEKGPSAIKPKFPTLIWPPATTVPPTALPAQGRFIIASFLNFIVTPNFNSFKLYRSQCTRMGSEEV
ncbi:uncharacterized protein LOC111714160 [Eurytemora carolleeae]|uniref:uncharacterized protein LOC111714160 n=1 Tax=Eurytemora carolleeae TaxID=1294199 RepID=UPI000C77995F|nr:uncharacterized protein LOC111714160 [Eurytemora carolleeae]|eukprot:XP_023344977.1 uncharacterized protein LOC111714160 [Eurytemora affinis]